MNSKLLFTTADSSLQSGAFRHLLFMSRGIARGEVYSPILALHREAQESSMLLSSLSSDDVEAYFFDLPRAKRRQSIAHYVNYAVHNIRSIYSLVRLMRREQVVLVHANEILDLYAGIAAKIAGVPCVWHVRADLAMVPRLGWFLTRAALTLADKIVVVSKSVQENMFGGLGEEKVIVVYDPGPDLAVFHPGVDGSRVREEYGVEDEAYLVTLVAKLSARKGHETLVRAAPRVLVSFPNTHFMFVGGELEAEHHKDYVLRLKSLVQELEIQNRVIFTGFRTDVPEIMAASDIVTHCSTYPDPFPGVVLQGMAVGRPVIAQDLGGPKEQIEHNVSGLLVEPGEPDALAEAICDLLADKDKREALGEAAVRRAGAFSAERFFGQLTELYKSVLRDDV